MAFLNEVASPFFIVFLSVSVGFSVIKKGKHQNLTPKAFGFKQKTNKVIYYHLVKNIRRLKIFVGRKYSSVEKFAGKKHSSVKNFVTKQFFRHFLPTKFLPIRYNSMIRRYPLPNEYEQLLFKRHTCECFF